MCGSEIDIIQRITDKIVSYKQEPSDRIVHGLQCKEKRDSKRGSPMYLRDRWSPNVTQVVIEEDQDGDPGLCTSP